MNQMRGPAWRGIRVVIDDAEAEPLVDRHIAPGACRKDGAHTLSPCTLLAFEDQGPTEATALASGIDSNRVELPEGGSGASVLDPTPELVVAMSAVIGQRSNPLLIPRMLCPRFESVGWDPHGSPARTSRHRDESKLKPCLEEEPEATREALNSVVHLTHGPTHHRFVDEGTAEERCECEESIWSGRRNRNLIMVHCDGSVSNRPPETGPRPSP